LPSSCSCSLGRRRGGGGSKRSEHQRTVRPGRHGQALDRNLSLLGKVGIGVTASAGHAVAPGPSPTRRTAHADDAPERSGRRRQVSVRRRSRGRSPGRGRERGRGQRSPPGGAPVAQHDERRGVLDVPHRVEAREGRRQGLGRGLLLLLLQLLLQLPLLRRLRLRQGLHKVTASYAPAEEGGRRLHSFPLLPRTITWSLPMIVRSILLFRSFASLSLASSSRRTTFPALVVVIQQWLLIPGRDGNQP